ncbi:tetratricopeptide repeat protein, partial [Agrobacterium vitis]
TSLNNLASLLHNMGDYAAAKPLYERALAISEKVNGPDHPSTGASLKNLASLLHDMSDYAAAKPLFERALIIFERGLGPAHPYSMHVRKILADFPQ